MTNKEVTSEFRTVNDIPTKMVELDFHERAIVYASLKARKMELEGILMSAALREDPIFAKQVAKEMERIDKLVTRI